MTDQQSNIILVLGAVDKASPIMKAVEKAVGGVGKAAEEAGEKAKELDKVDFSKMLAGAGKATGALLTVAATIKKALDFAKEGAQIERLFETGSDIAASAGANYDMLLKKVAAAAHGTIANSDLMLSTNKAMMLGLGADADQLANLMQIAAYRGRAMGIETTQAFSDMVTGIGRVSPMILDNLGIVLDSEATFSKYAESIGKTSSELTKAEKVQALLNATLEEGNKMLDAAGGLQDDRATIYEQMAASIKNLWDEVKRGADATFGQQAAFTITAMLGGTTQQQEIRTNLEIRNQALIKDSANYEAYVAEMLRLNALVNGGGADMVLGQELLTNPYSASGGNILNQSQFNLARAKGKPIAGPSTQIMNNALAAQAAGTVYGPFQQDTGIQQATMDYGNLLSVIQNLQSQTDAYKEKQADLQSKLYELGRTMQQIRRYDPFAVTGKAKETLKDIDEVKAAMAALNAENLKAQHQLALNMVTQQAASTGGGIDPKEFALIMGMGEGWGIFTQEVVDQSTTLVNAMSQIDTAAPDKLVDTLTTLFGFDKNLAINIVVSVTGDTSLLDQVTNAQNKPVTPQTPMAAGGFVPLTAGIAGQDSVPAMLMPGEFVLNRRAVGMIGLPSLMRMNSGSTQRFANGGPVGAAGGAGGDRHYHFYGPVYANGSEIGLNAMDL